MDRKVAVVTGANRGIGFEIARQLAKLGIFVILTSRNKTKGLLAEKKLQEEKLEVIFHQLDVIDEASIHTLGEFIKKEYGRLDILVNNAGVMLDRNDSETATVFKAKLDTIKKTMEINLYGPLLICQELIPIMKKKIMGEL